jgi:hypothetical protein
MTLSTTALTAWVKWIKKHIKNGQSFSWLQYPILNVECKNSKPSNFILSMMHNSLKPNLILYFSKIEWDNQYLGYCGNKALGTLDGTNMPVQMKFSIHVP